MYNKEIIEPKLSNLTEKSGVYIMKNDKGEIIYVGKAVNLKRRVMQYFRNCVKEVKVQAMVDNIFDFDYVVTLSEVDALTLEATLIKKHMPRYNILLKDDKGGGAYIKIDLSVQCPTFELTRKYKRTNEKYFGPYANMYTAKQILSAVQTAYGVRTCTKGMKSRRECLNYHIGLCLAPCTKKTDAATYRNAALSAVSFLSGRTDDVSRIIEQKMQNAAEQDDYERAIKYRDVLQRLSQIGSRSLVNLQNLESADIFAYITDGITSAVSVMPVRGNKLLAAVNYSSSDASESGDALTAFCLQYYQSNPLPDEIYVNIEVDESLEQWLRELKGSAVKVYVPKKGIKRDLALTAEENARERLTRDKQKQEQVLESTYLAAEKLRGILDIKSARRIECYDISHISGTDKVASGVCFINGAKAGSEYRRYRIKTVEGNDDFHCMAEVLSRRLNRAKEGDEKFSDMPNLIVIDGGKGQLSAAREVMLEAGFDIPMVGLAKREEEIFTSSGSEPIRLSRDHAALKLLQRIRDEAHRFAITYHRRTRSRRIGTKLTEIDGIGEKKAKLLLKEFGSLKNIGVLPLSALESLKGISKVDAVNIYNYFNENK